MTQRKIIWLGIVMSTFVYAVVLYVMSNEWPPPGSYEDALRQRMTLPLYAVALMTFGMGFVIPRFIKTSQTALVVQLALFDAVAIYGLMAAFLAQDWRLYIAPWVLALIGFMTRFPSDNVTN